MTSIGPRGIQRALDGCFVHHTVDILSWETCYSERREKKVADRSHLGNNIRYGGIWRNEGHRDTTHCGGSPLWGVLRAASATGKVTGHFHLDLHINLSPSYAVNNTGGSEGTAIKLEEKCILFCQHLPVPMQSLALCGPCLIYITEMLKTDISAACITRVACQMPHSAAATSSVKISTFVWCRASVLWRVPWQD